MSKRKAEFIEEEDNYLDDLVKDKQNNQPSNSKHTLDSDEEDSGDEDQYNVLGENDILGEEDGIARVDGETKITPFNMKEELEEGHFDAEGHYQWKKEKEVKDSWLDNIDWVKVKSDANYQEKQTNQTPGLGDSDSDDDDEDNGPLGRFDDIATYRQMLEMMQPKETVKRTLQRLGKGTAKLTTAQRWKLKKAGKPVDDTNEQVTKFTALSNDILTKNGNMDVYEETYEFIQKKIQDFDAKQAHASDEELDMYADDFGTREKGKLKVGEKMAPPPARPPLDDETVEKAKPESAAPMWEYKDQQHAEEVHGPFTTEQMQKYAEEGRFSSGAFARKVGSDDARFYSAARIDFDLYL